MSEMLVGIIDLLVTGLWLAILGRVIMSWVSPRGGDPLSRVLHRITEPFLDPLRRIIPPLGMFDLGPMVALILLSVVWPFIRSVLTSSL